MKGIHYGGDYNPDQWPPEVWEEDFRLFKKAGVTMLTLPVFSWAKFQPSENEYRFDWFDTILERLTGEGFSLCLATSTAVQPAWMSRKYPDMLPVDFEGRKRQFGGRVKFCPNNPDYRRLSAELVRRLASRYGKNPALSLWHVGNEYDNWCYCETCQKGFRLWLRERYGSIERLNQVWYSSFWGHSIYDWDEIVAPYGLSEMWIDRGRMRSNFQSMSLDYARFMSESILGCFLNEKRILREITPDIPVTTNFMGYFSRLDYFRWAEHVDIISWDSYPGPEDQPWKTALWHDLMRSLKGGKPFLLMEQTPSQQNWQPYNRVKAPGVLRLQSWQAVARGSDSVMFFQMRRSAGACEKFHSALIDHGGSGDTRVFRECAALGAELAESGSGLPGSRIRSSVAILFDWENWWAVEYSSGPSNLLDYMEQIGNWYRYFHRRNIPVDFRLPGSPLDEYSLVLAPCLYLFRAEQGELLSDYVHSGGTLVTGFMTAIVDEHDRVHEGSYPAPLRELLGLRVEEIDALPPGVTNTAVPETSQGSGFGGFGCSIICDIIFTEGAEVLAHYGKDFYRGSPVITRNYRGRGCAYYTGSSLDDEGIEFVLSRALEDSPTPPWADWHVPEGVEISLRESDDAAHIFILNHNEDPVEIEGGPDNTEASRLLEKPAKRGGGLRVEGRGVRVLKMDRAAMPPSGRSITAPGNRQQ